MKRFLSAVLAATVLASTLTLPTSAASAQPAEPIRSVDSLTREFAQSGFQTSVPVTWWTNRVTTFTARDGGDRMVMVLVYPSVEAAQAERSQAAARDGDGDMDNPHPHLVPGYGRSEFRANVAMVETSYSMLSRLYADQSDNGIVDMAGTSDADLAQEAVDRALVAQIPVDDDFLAMIIQRVVVDL